MQTSQRVAGNLEADMKATARQQQTHPYISKQGSICGGRSIIAGTRTPVWSLVKWYKLGFTIEDIIREFPGVTPAQVHDAFSYFYLNFCTSLPLPSELMGLKWIDVIAMMSGSYAANLSRSSQSLSFSFKFARGAE